MGRLQSALSAGLSYGVKPSKSKYPPAEPEALRLLAPQRGLIATDQNQTPRLATSGLIGKSAKGLGEADC